MTDSDPDLPPHDGYTPEAPPALPLLAAVPHRIGLIVVLVPKEGA